MVVALAVGVQAPIPRLQVRTEANLMLGIAGSAVDYFQLQPSSSLTIPLLMTAPAVGDSGTVRLAVIVYGEGDQIAWEKTLELNVVAAPEGNYASPYSRTEIGAARLYRRAEADPAFRGEYQRAIAELSTGRRVVDFSSATIQGVSPGPEKPTENLTIPGRFQWRDIVKGADAKHSKGTGGLYPCMGLKVEAYDKADATKRVLATATTANDGTYSLSIARNAVDATASAFTLVVRIQASATKFAIRTPTVAGSAIYAYEVEATGITDQRSFDAQAGKLQVIFEGTSADAATRQQERVWAIYSCMYFLQTVVLKTSSIVSTPSWTVRFPGTSLTVSDYRSAAVELGILVEDYADFDVMAHEFGHLLQDKQALLTNQTGGMHTLQSDLIVTNGKDAGSRLAWSEGMATALGLLMQVEGRATPAMGPRFGDLNYDDFEDSSISHSVENDEGVNPNSEGNEVVVARILFDYADNLNSGETFDVSTKGFGGLIAQLKSARAARLEDFWKSAAGTGLFGFFGDNSTTNITSISQVVLNQLAPIFAYNGVAPLPISPKGAKEIPAAGDTIPFRWKGNINTVYGGQSYRVLFLDTTGNVVASSAVFTRTEADVTANVPRTLLNTARAAVGTSGVLLWTVAGIDSAAPLTGAYVGPPLSLEESARIIFVIDDTGSMGPEIAGVRDGLLNVIAQLAGSGTRSTLQLITFKDVVTVRAPSSDLSVIQRQVAGLTASGGGDTPESSVEALWEAARIIKSSGLGGTVFLATDAPPHAGFSIPATISALRAAGARVNVILTGSGFSKPTDDPLPEQTGEPTKANGDESSYVSPLTAIELAALIPDADFTGSVDAFGDIAAGTGGTLVTLPKTDTARIAAAVQNLTLSGLLGGVVQVLPRSAPAGARLQLVIQGQNTNFDSRTSVSFSRGLTVNGVVVSSPVELVVDVTLASTATTGAVSVTATTGTELAQGANIFQIDAPSTVARLLSLVPSVIVRGTEATFRIRGYNTNFSSTSVVAIDGRNVTAKSTRSISATELEVVLEATLLADRTFRSLTVGTLGLGQALRVASSDVAAVGVVSAVAPGEIPAGSTTSVTLVGSGVAWDSTSVVLVSGTDVTAGSVTVVSPTEINVRLTVATAATPGFRDVFVRNGETTVAGLQLLKVAASTARLINLSTRGVVPVGGALTPGFVIKGSGSKQLVIRGVGPALTAFGVTTALSDPRLDLFVQGATSPMLSNDNWGGSTVLTGAFAAVGAFPLNSASRDAAVQVSLSAAGLSGYSARLTSVVTTESGVALTETYDSDSLTSPIRLVNLSTLGFVGTGDNVLTVGFVVRGAGGKQLLIRAVGPGLAQFGVGSLLADPQLTVFPAGQSTSITSNNDWGGTAALKTAFGLAGAFVIADASRDAAVVVNLQPGGYTVIVSGVGGTTGSALVEVYDLDP
jgi:Quinohemoprotein amine dehydrogenase, alpha subunit domain III